MLKLLHEVGRSVAVLHDNALLFVYRYGEGWPKPHFHPLYAPNSTRVMTLHAPHDYLHHRGLMWSWGQVASQGHPDHWVNFWEERVRGQDEEGRTIWPRPLDEQHRGAILHTGFETLQPGRERAFLIASHEWRCASDNSLLLHQRQKVTAYPLAPEGWFFDLQFEMRAANEPVILGRMPDDGTSDYDSTPYGLGCQLARAFAGGALLNSNGQRGPQCCDAPAAWCDYSGPVDDDEGDDDGWTGLTIMNHPSNPVHPTPFFALTERTAFLAATPTKHEPLLISPPSPRVFTFRIFVHLGRGEKSALDQQYDRFAATPLS